MRRTQRENLSATVIALFALLAILVVWRNAGAIGRAGAEWLGPSVVQFAETDADTPEFAPLAPRVVKATSAARKRSIPQTQVEPEPYAASGPALDLTEESPRSGAANPSDESHEPGRAAEMWAQSLAFAYAGGGGSSRSFAGGGSPGGFGSGAGKQAASTSSEQAETGPGGKASAQGSRQRNTVADAAPANPIVFSTVPPADGVVADLSVLSPSFPSTLESTDLNPLVTDNTNEALGLPADVKLQSAAVGTVVNPEPTTLLLLGTGLMLAARRVRRNRAKLPTTD